MPNLPARALSDLHASLPTSKPGSLLQAIDIRFVELAADRVVATMPVNELTSTPFGRLHGGASAALVETVASTGGALNIDRAKQFVVGIEVNANHLRGIGDGHVIAEGLPLHRGRSTQVWEVKIRDDADRLVCAGRCTLAVVDR